MNLQTIGGSIPRTNNSAEAIVYKYLYGVGATCFSTLFTLPECLWREGFNPYGVR